MAPHLTPLLLACTLAGPTQGRPSLPAAPGAPPSLLQLGAWVPLGQAPDGRLRAVLAFRPAAREAVEGTLYLRTALDPVAPNAAPARVSDTLVGRGWRMAAGLRACRFGSGQRSQAVVTLLGTGPDISAAQLHVLDFDGRRVRRVYGRVGLKGARVEQVRGRWHLAEDWDIGSYRSVPGRGGAEDIGGGRVRRWLYWNGRAIVPDVPGQTRVIAGSSAGLPSVYRYVPQRSVTFVRPQRGGPTRVRIGPATTRDNPEFGRSVAVHPSGRFLYTCPGGSSGVAQYRIGRYGAIAPLRPASVYAPDHPSSISFHPTGRFAYVSCSHGAVCQFRILPTGQLEPLQPGLVYGESTPSELRFSRWGRYALVVAARREMLPSGEAGDAAGDDAGYLYRVDEDGTLAFVRQVPGEGFGYQAASVTVRWGGRGRVASRSPRVRRRVVEARPPAVVQPPPRGRRGTER